MWEDAERNTEHIQNNHLNKHHTAVLHHPSARRSVDWTFRADWLLIFGLLLVQRSIHFLSVHQTLVWDTLSWNISHQIIFIFLRKLKRLWASQTHSFCFQTRCFFISSCLIFICVQCKRSCVEDDDDCFQEQQIIHSRSVAQWNKSPSTWLWGH